jgi:hypothetical protein
MEGSKIQSLVVCTVACLVVATSGIPALRGEVIDLEFRVPPASESEPERTLDSLVKVRGPDGVHLNGLYLLSHIGDRSKLFSAENRSMIEDPLIDRPWRYCSLFSSGDSDGMIVGRNWDNENVGSIIVNLYRPDNGYASISFARAIDMNLPLNVDLVEFRDHPAARGLLLAPFYAYDGINEHGLVVGVAGVRQVEVHPQEGKQLTFVPYLVRLILDSAKDIDEAVEIVSGSIPFDLDSHSLNSHLLVADASGRSAILEYVDDEWKIFPGEGTWQVLENRAISGATDEMLRTNGWRHRTMSEALESFESTPAWAEGLEILEKVAQKGTSWSAIYSPTDTDVHFTVYQDWDEVYRLDLPVPAAPQMGATRTGRHPR